MSEATAPSTVIIASTENDGAYTWTVDASLPDGTDYQVRVSCTDASGIYGESGNFKIEDQSITVTEPTSSSFWAKGKSANISWTFTGTIGSVKIELYKGGSYLQSITSSTANDGAYTYSVSSSLVEASDYKVRISNVNIPSVYGESDAFTIEDQWITITDPTSSTVWTRGEQATITWTSKGTLGNVKIDLYWAGSFQMTIVASTENDGSYTWTVDSTPWASTYWNVRISSINTAGVSATSAYFEIK